jgi:hypothetical protein
MSEESKDTPMSDASGSTRLIKLKSIDGSVNELLVNPNVSGWMEVLTECSRF